MSAATDVEPRTYRGATIDELIPQIREELGPEAVILRQREGLDGGVAGFFQKRCVEVVARSGAPGIDAYDEKKPEPSSVSKPASVPKPAFGIDPKPAFGFPARLEPEPEPEPESPPEPEGAFEPDPAPEPEPAPESEPAHAPEPQPVAPAIEHILRGSAPFVEHLEQANGRLPEAPVERNGHVNGHAPARPAAIEPAAVEPAAVEPGAGEPPEPEPAVLEPAQRSELAATHERSLIEAGLSPGLAASVIEATISHALVFDNRARGLKGPVRQTLARRIPIAATDAPGGRTIALVGAGGAGKTASAARLASAYVTGSDLDVSVVNLDPAEAGAELRALLGPVGVEVLDGRAEGIAPVPGARVLTIIDTPGLSPSHDKEIKRLARDLRRFGPCEAHLVVPATLSASAMRRLLDAFAPVAPSAIVLTHLDEVDQAGAVIDVAIDRGIGISYCVDDAQILPADRTALARRVMR